VVPKFSQYTDDEDVLHTVAEQEAAAIAQHLEQKRAQKKSAVQADYNAAIAELTVGYDSYEISSWPQQAEEAKARTANPNAEVPLVAALAAARGMRLSEMVTRILQKEALFKPAFGAILGTKQARILALGAAETLEEIDAI
jgi:hypothetical protein